MVNKKTTDYIQLRSELDELLENLQSGQIDIEDSIEAYKRGQEIIAELQNYLKNAENKVTKLKKDFSA